MTASEASGFTTGDAGVERILAGMTLEEKAALTVGRDSWTTLPIERLGLPSVWLSDGPTGLRKARGGDDMSLGHNVPATCFPTESALGASWDRELVREVAGAIALEAQAEGVQVVLAPGVNLKRSPLCGRNFEYFSEDPVLAGELAAAFVTGLQEHGIGASVKHLTANECETDRMLADSRVDERALRELYLRPFEIAVEKADPWTLMAAYNRLNGTYCAEHPRLLRQIVAEEWGYQGIVVSDWIAVNDRAAGIEAGLHLQMPAAPTALAIVAAVREGRLSEARLDAVLRSLIAFILKADAARQPGTTVDREAHHRLARRAAAESVVLLTNVGGLLPLEGDARADIALIGRFAAETRYQGSGSSQVVPALPVSTLWQELSTLVGAAGHVTYAAGYAVDGGLDRVLLAEAQEAARQARTAVVAVGLPGSYEEEGSDRAHLDLPPGHNALVEAVLAVQPRTVVVLIGGSALALPWAARVPALLEGWLGGQAAAGGLADVLLGRVNPSGRLAETFPMRLEDTPAYLSFISDGGGTVPFSESIFTGYRWYEARRLAPLFPFGHGLSYTTFAWSNAQLEGTAHGGDPLVRLSLQVQNAGSRAGSEIVQLYVRELQPRLRRAEKELKAFAKVVLEPGEQHEVRFELGRRDFALYDPEAAAWVITSREFELLAGASSADIRASIQVTLPQSVVHAAALTRLSPLRLWLTNPAVRERLRPVVSALQRRFFGAEADLPGEGNELGDLTASFLADLPIAKLVMLGALREDELSHLMALAAR